MARLRLVEYAPGVAARNHRNRVDRLCGCDVGRDSTGMDGTTVHLRAGDVLVQRGTIH